MGAPRSFLFGTLLAEAGLLAAAGALPGLLLAAFTVYLFRTLIIRTLGVPFLFPGLPALLIMVVGGLVIVLLGVFLAAFFPAFHISRQEPAVAMRE
jgi:ABC-type antimicrobial peptide transport system permease subunit